MKRLERKLLLHCLAIGAALTALVLIADAAGALGPLERWLYDRRARSCQFFTPPPTKTLVHLDIDDRALEVIGRWPWLRSTWALLLDEIRLAGPKAIEMDVLLADPQSPVEDATLADAIARCGNVILPIQLESQQRESPLYQAMLEALRDDPELGEEELLGRLRARGLVHSEAPPDELFIRARREAVFQRIRQELAKLPATTQATSTLLRERLLTRKRDLASPLSRLIDQQHENVRAHREAERFALPRPGSGPPITPAQIKLPPLRILSESASAVAFVDYPQFDDAVVRAVPMFLECDGKLFPQMGLALACAMLDLDPSAMRIGAREIILPRAGDDMRIPLAWSRVSSSGLRLHALFDIPWFGPRDWRVMYDHPRHAVAAQHLSLVAVWDAQFTLGKIRRNNALVDEALRALLGVLDRAKYEAFMKGPPARDDIAARAALARALIDDARMKATVALYESMSPAELQADPDGREFKASHTALHNWLSETPALAEQLKSQRAALSAALRDKAALVGWIATAAVADLVPTSLHDKCPGVVVHGAVYNGIMTGEMWRRVPWGVTAIVTIVLGVATAAITGYLAPVPALLASLALFAGYALLNGIALFDFGNRILGAAAPLAVVGIVWAGCTLTRVIVERAERERIRRRFSNYVDPKIVNYFLEDPNATAEGEKREMTVVFTDLVGFTSLSEKMGEKVVPLLNDLLGELVPVIRRHEGTLNKFLGDGIMFFFNAPFRRKSHASDAVATVLDMHATISRFNERLIERGMPPLGMRAGISTAEMIVGNAGGADANDYTVLGDAVNLGARLEAANKLIGTRTLMTARTADLLDGNVLCRPIGRLKVVGKDEPAMVYEPLAAADTASEKERDIAALTTQMVDAFVTSRFADALAILDQIEALEAGPSKFTTLYRGLCERYLREPPGEGFDGRVVLTEK
jgi:class 3 adenylate cyclase/CHASE2 domain-containing sensor protein